MKVVATSIWRLDRGVASEGRGLAAGQWTAQRQLYLDNLKVILIAAVIAIHGALSYAGFLEVWTYSDVREVTYAPATEIVLLVAVSPVGLFMMTLLFLSPAC